MRPMGMKYVAAAVLIAGLDHNATSAQFVIGMDNDQRDQVDQREWQTGDKVLVNRRGDNLWYPGTIKGKSGPDYRISYEDGQAGRASAVYIAARSFKVGDTIMVNYRRNEPKKYRATVFRVTDREIQARIIDRQYRGMMTSTPWGRMKFATDELPAQPAVPPPAPEPTPEPDIVVCNNNSDTVHFALKFYVADYANVQQGWWQVAPGACTRLHLETLQNGLSGLGPYGGGALYIYGETDGILGGIIKQTWPRDMGGIDSEGRDLSPGCVGGSTDEAFLHTSWEARKAGVERGFVECPQSSQRIDMAKLSETEGVYRYTFEGWE